MREMASLLVMWPEIMKNVRGRVVQTTSQDGLTRPCLRTGRSRLRVGNDMASRLRNKHHPDTNRNWTIVRVTGFGNVWSTDLEAVLDMIDERYQMTKSD